MPNNTRLRCVSLTIPQNTLPCETESFSTNCLCSQGVDDSSELMLWTAPARQESAIDVGAVRTPYDLEEPGHANDCDR